MKNKKNNTTNSLIKYMILDNDMINENKEYVKMIKINPVAIDALPDDEQWKLIFNLSYMLNLGISKKYQLFSTSEAVDIKDIIRQYDKIASQYDYNDDVERKKLEILRNEKDRLALASMDHEIAIKAFYIILSNSDKTKLNKEVEDYGYELSSCGLFSHECSLRESTSLLYKYFNPRRSIYEKFPKSFSKEFDINDFIKTENISLIADEENQFQSFIRVDGIYQKIFYIAAYDESPAFHFLGNICLQQDCDVSIQLTYVSTEKIKKSYDEMATTMRERMSKTPSDSEFKEIQKNYDTILQTITKISAEGIQSNTLFITIRISAETVEDLKYKIKGIKENLSKMSIIIREGFNEQLDLFKTNSPLGTNYYSNSYSKEVTTDVVGFGFPMIQETYIDQHLPIYIGRTKMSNGPVFYDSSELTELKLNRNEFMAGLIGSGKTTFFLMLMYVRYGLGEDQFIIDIEGNQLRNFVENMNGIVVDCSNGKKGGLNPLQVRIEYQSKKIEMETNFALSEIYPLSLHLLFLKNFFRIFLGKIDLSEIERRVTYLDILLIAFYRKWNINFETNALEIKNMKTTDFPIFSDLFEFSKKLYDDEKYKLIPKEIHLDINATLMDLAEGTAAVMFNCHTINNFEESNLVLFDISSLYGKDDIMLEAHYYNILSFIWGYILTSTSNKIIRLNIDEVKAAIGGKFPYTAALLESYALRCRKHNCGLTCATQQIKDAMRFEYGETIFNQAQYKFIFKIDDTSANKLLEISPKYRQDDLDFITNKAVRGDCLYYSGIGYSHRVSVQLGYMYELFETWKNK